MSRLLKSRRGHDSEDGYSGSENGEDDLESIVSTDFEEGSIHSLSELDRSDLSFDEDSTDAEYTTGEVDGSTEASGSEDVSETKTDNEEVEPSQQNSVQQLGSTTAEIDSRNRTVKNDIYSSVGESIRHTGAKAEHHEFRRDLLQDSRSKKGTLWRYNDKLKDNLSTGTLEEEDAVSDEDSHKEDINNDKSQRNGGRGNHSGRGGYLNNRNNFQQQRRSHKCPEEDWSKTKSDTTVVVAETNAWANITPDQLQVHYAVTSPKAPENKSISSSKLVESSSVNAENSEKAQDTNKSEVSLNSSEAPVHTTNQKEEDIEEKANDWSKAVETPSNDGWGTTLAAPSWTNENTTTIVDTSKANTNDSTKSTKSNWNAANAHSDNTSWKANQDVQVVEDQFLDADSSTEASTPAISAREIDADSKPVTVTKDNDALNTLATSTTVDNTHNTPTISTTVEDTSSNLATSTTVEDTPSVIPAEEKASSSWAALYAEAEPVRNYHRNRNLERTYTPRIRNDYESRTPEYRKYEDRFYEKQQYSPNHSPRRKHNNNYNSTVESKSWSVNKPTKASIEKSAITDKSSSTWDATSADVSSSGWGTNVATTEGATSTTAESSEWGTISNTVENTGWGTAYVTPEVSTSNWNDNSVNTIENKMTNSWNTAHSSTEKIATTDSSTSGWDVAPESNKISSPVKSSTVKESVASEWGMPLEDGKPTSPKRDEPLKQISSPTVSTEANTSGWGKPIENKQSATHSEESKKFEPSAANETSKSLPSTPTDVTFNPDRNTKSGKKNPAIFVKPALPKKYVASGWGTLTEGDKPSLRVEGGITTETTTNHKWSKSTDTSNPSHAVKSIASPESANSGWNTPLETTLSSQNNKSAPKKSMQSSPSPVSSPSAQTAPTWEVLPDSSTTVGEQTSTGWGVSSNTKPTPNGWGTSESSNWNMDKKIANRERSFGQNKDQPRKSRGYLSQKLETTPPPPPTVYSVSEQEQHCQGDSDSDVEIILEADEEPDWAKSEQILGMTAPSEDQVVNSSRNYNDGSNIQTESSHHNQHKNIDTQHRKSKRNLDDNWRQRDEVHNDNEVGNTVPPMYYPQPHHQLGNIAYLPMIPNAPMNVPPMYAMPFPMGLPSSPVVGSVSPNNSTGGSDLSPHINNSHLQMYPPPMVNGPNGLQLPPGYEANGMVYYGMDPSAMYVPPQQYYYYPSMPRNMPPMFYPPPPLQQPQSALPNYYRSEEEQQEDGWGPPPEVQEGEEWSLSHQKKASTQNYHHDPSAQYIYPQQQS